MATINIGGLATGLDTNQIVSQLVALERRRSVALLQIEQLEQQSRQSALAGFGTKLADVLAAVDKLRDPSSALARKATSSDTTVLTATAGSGALNGTTQITVHDLARNSVATSATGVASATATVAAGAGTFAFRVGSGDLQSIAIDASTTLEGLASAINALGAGASATVVNLGTVSTPDYRLRLASRDAGTSSELTIETDDTSLGVAVTQNATNASFSVSGFATPFTRESNVVNDVISGVTLSLEKTGGPVNVTVSTDTATVKKDVEAVVTAFNELVAFVNAQSAVTQDTSSTDRDVTAGPLAFDGTVRSVVDGLRTAISSAIDGLDGDFSLLAEAGITATRDGTLKLDGAALEAALSSNESSISELFGGNGASGGVFDRVHDYLSGVTGAGGLLELRSKGVTASLDALRDRIEAGERQVAAFEQNLRDTFTNLELLVSRIQSQGAFLLSALGRTS